MLKGSKASETTHCARMNGLSMPCPGPCGMNRISDSTPAKLSQKPGLNIENGSASRMATPPEWVTIPTRRPVGRRTLAMISATASSSSGVSTTVTPSESRTPSRTLPEVAIAPVWEAIRL
jgi:hypothetical protein